MSKHLVNKAGDWAKEAIQGYLHVNNAHMVALKEHPNVVVRSDWPSVNDRVALLAGGGSGHEPAHTGFIGHGMLTGVICGDLFASPSTAAILSAIRYVSKPSGVLLIVKNYTGDRLNFGLAAKKAQLEGIDVDWIMVDDDISLENTENSTGKRGLCGTVFIEKIAGALAEQKKSLKEIKECVEAIITQNRLKTLGVSLSGRVQLPGETYIPSKNDDLIEVGLGIHGEAGRTKIHLKSSQHLAQLVFEDYLFKELPSNDICLMINNLGGLSNLELHVLANDCVNYILNQRSGIKIRRIYTGGFMTSLNMNGFSVTLLSLESSVDNVLSLLDADTSATAWQKNYGVDIGPLKYTDAPENVKENKLEIDENKFFKLSTENGDLFKNILMKICKDLINMKERLNELDMVCGDGDCGNSLSKISETILKDVDEGQFNFEYPNQVFLHLSEIFENGGGSLSILLALFFSASVKDFRKTETPVSKHDQISWVNLFLNSLESGIKAVQEYGRAKPNQRSIIDPLFSVKIYLNDFLNKASDDSTQIEISKLVDNLADISLKSAELTAKMAPRVGRASYVDPSLINSPDAGAIAISSIFASIKQFF